MKSKPGRPPSIEAQKIVNAIINHADKIIISKSGNIVEKRNVIWKTISNILDNKISPYSLYSYVTDNRLNIKNKLFEREGICDHKSFNTTNDTSMDFSINLSNSSDSSFHENVKRSYVIFFPKDEYESLIETKIRHYYIGTRKRRSQYKSFKSGIWEDKINDKLVDLTKIKCGLNFRNHYISANGNFASFTGLVILYIFQDRLYLILFFIEYTIKCFYFTLK